MFNVHIPDSSTLDLIILNI